MRKASSTKARFEQFAMKQNKKPLKTAGAVNILFIQLILSK